MRHARNAVLGVVAIMLAVVLSFGWATSTPEPVQAQGIGCILDISGTIGVVICGGEIIGRLPLPTITVKGPTITLPPLPPVTIRPPRVTETVRVTVPAQTITVGENATVVVTETANGSNSTSTVTQTKTVTESVLPSDAPTETVTAETTVTASPTGQPVVEDDSIDEPPPALDLGDGRTTYVEVGLGLVTILALVGLLLCALWAGYALGYKDKERKDTSFMRALLEQATVRRGKHS